MTNEIVEWKVIFMNKRALLGTISGHVKDGFEEVEEAFRMNFQKRGELGAACAIYLEGEKVVDLWGGYRDHKKRDPWNEDTLVSVFSTTKGFAALVVAFAHSKGYVDYDEKVSTYWPEFSQQGKGDITVRQLLSHQAGLSTLDPSMDLNRLEDFDTRHVVDAIAAKEPVWQPGTRQGYHCWTIGWYIGELIHRVDPNGRRIGQFFQEEIAKPLGIELYLGVPDTLEDDRIAVLKGINHPIQLMFHINEITYSLFKEFMNKKSLTYRSMLDPKMLLKHKNHNRRELRSIEFPSGNGVGLVRDMAKLYNAFVIRGSVLDLREESLNEIVGEPIRPTEEAGIDVVLRNDIRFYLGFMRPTDFFSFGSDGRSFGYAGAGGSFCFADPTAQVGYAYAMTKVGYHLVGDPREEALRKAFYRCIRS